MLANGKFPLAMTSTFRRPVPLDKVVGVLLQVGVGEIVLRRERRSIRVALDS